MTDVEAKYREPKKQINYSPGRKEKEQRQNQILIKDIRQNNLNRSELRHV